MYHYVRPLAQSAYPRIKGLDTALFDAQLDYLAHYYEPVTMENVLGALKGKTELPERAVLLSFDDGYRDHYEEVFPRLEKRGFKGAFYPPQQPSTGKFSTLTKCISFSPLRRIPAC